VNVLVTGGTGTLGRHVVMALRQSGHRARILSREPRGHVDAVQGDLRTGEGLENAAAGMDAIVHAATGARKSLASRATDVRGTRRLLDICRENNIKHFVYISIVGMDGVAFPYYGSKLRAEAMVKEEATPWSILRATQFHDLMETFLSGFSRLPGVTMIPFDWQFQPVHAREVALRVVDVVLGEPAGILPDFGGPEVRDFKAMARSWLIARKEDRRLVNLRLPFKFSKQFASGRLTCPDHKDGKISFEHYLAERYPLS
jgi:uncharacterized protein YbjT (DUF2867 family)